ncbi:hypothetical protein AB0J52_19565 [Spirillospora sp. NPDC049652]
MSETQWGLWAAAVAVAILGVVGGAAYARSQGEKARLRGLREWAAAHGWTVADGHAGVPWRDRVPFETFRPGIVLLGEVDGRPASVGGGSYSVRKTVGLADGAERSETATYHLTVLTVRGEHGTPDMEIRGRGLGAKLMESLAAHTAADAFEARFEVVPDEARGRLSDAAVQAHLDSEVPAWSVRDGEIMAVLPGKPHAEELDGHLDVLRRLTAVVPAADGTPAPPEG